MCSFSSPFDFNCLWVKRRPLLVSDPLIFTHQWIDLFIHFRDCVCQSSWEHAMLKKKIHRRISRIIKTFMENYGSIGDKHLISIMWKEPW